MIEFILSVLAVVRVLLCSRADMALEILALRQQVAVLKRKRPRPTLNAGDRFFWSTLRRFWSRWRDVLVIVKPETVVAWHSAGFRLYWRWRSRPSCGRPKIPAEIRVLIRCLAEENPCWGAPKVHGNSRSSATLSPNGLWLAISDDWHAVTIQANGGWLSYKIIER